MILLSRAMRLSLAAAALLGIALSSAEAHAQRHFSELRIDQLQPATPGSPFTRAEGPHDEFDEGIAWGARATVDYGLMPLKTTRVQDGVEVDEAAPVAHALLGHLGGAIVPWYFLNIELGFTFAMYETGDDVVGPRAPNGQPLEAGTAGIGDLRVGAHGRVLSTDDADVSLGMRVWAPTGRPDNAYLTGPDKFVRWEVVPAVAGELDLLRYGCTLGLAPLFFAGRDGDRLAASCAAQFKVAPMVSVGIEPHFAVFSYAPLEKSPTGQLLEPEKITPGLGKADFAFQLEPLASVMFHVAGFQIGAAAGPGIGNAPGTPDVRAVLSIGYSDLGKRKVVVKGPKDSDLDGIPDKDDACPDEAGTKERGGCPTERDLDGDGIIEGDACPDEPGARYDDPEANGCPDRDNDHFADPVDPCPDEPGASSDGCPKHARLAGDEFEVKPPLQFARGGTRLTDTSRAAMIEIVQTMRANPKLEQVSVTIGTRGAPKRITDLRAQELLELLNEQNLDASRYEVVLSDELRSGDLRVRVIR